MGHIEYVLEYGTVHQIVETNFLCDVHELRGFGDRYIFGRSKVQMFQTSSLPNIDHND